MKVLKYRLMTEVNHGTEEQPDIHQIFSDVKMGWSESNEEIAKREAYNGEYIIEDDGKDPPGETPEEKVQKDREEMIVLLKQKLSDTDYQAIKFSEGWFTEGEFAPMKAYRQSLRNKINELENGGNPYTFSFYPGPTPTIVHSEEEVSEWPSLKSARSL